MPIRPLKNLLVTGGCGFIGSAFIRATLNEGKFDGRIVNLDALNYAANRENVGDVAADPRYIFVHGNINDGELVGYCCDTHQIDTIVHFAAESHVDRSIASPKVFIETNVLGTFSLLEETRKRPRIHFHHVSTDEVYGSLGPSGRFEESTPYSPNSPYSASKASSDHFVRAFAETYGISVTVSNCSNNYGPFQFPEKLLPLMILNMLERKPLPVYGDGSNVRDWLHVDDHVLALWRVLRDGRSGETYNIGGDAEWANLKLLHKLTQIVASELSCTPEELRSLITFVRDRPGHDKRYAIDCTKIKSELGWHQTHTIDTGLSSTVRWYLDNPRWVDRVRSGDYRNWLLENYSGRN